jgi:hypothetical protein
MTKYTADEYELRVATSEADLASAPVLSGWQKLDVKVKQGRKKRPDGIGSRLQRVKETLLDYSGSVSADLQESPLAGSSDELTALGMFQQGSLTPLYIELKNKITGSKIHLCKCTGDPAVSIASPEAFVTWAWDFDFEDINKS